MKKNAALIILSVVSVVLAFTTWHFWNKEKQARRTAISMITDTQQELKRVNKEIAERETQLRAQLIQDALPKLKMISYQRGYAGRSHPCVMGELKNVSEQSIRMVRVTFNLFRQDRQANFVTAVVYNVAPGETRKFQTQEIDKELTPILALLEGE